MINYVLLTEIKTETTKDEWWMDLTNNSETLRIFNSFDKAKSEMRKAVTQIIKKCDFFPLKNGQYEPIEEYYEDIAEFGSEEIKKLGDIICNTINNPDYFCEESDLNIKDIDNANWYFAFVGNKDLILADHYEKTLKTNIHNMSDDLKHYYFNYFEMDDNCRIVNSILIRLLNDAKKDAKA